MRLAVVAVVVGFASPAFAEEGIGDIPANAPDPVHEPTMVIGGGIGSISGDHANGFITTLAAGMRVAKQDYLIASLNFDWGVGYGAPEGVGAKSFREGAIAYSRMWCAGRACAAASGGLGTQRASFDLGGDREQYVKSRTTAFALAGGSVRANFGNFVWLDLSFALRQHVRIDGDGFMNERTDRDSALTFSLYVAP